MAQEVIEITEREVEIIEVIERGPVGPTGPQPNINYEVVSSARTLEAADLIAADTSGGAFTLTLPANPSNGDAVDIFDFSETFDTNPLTIARNGQPIESLNEDLVANVEGAYFTLIYTGSTRGWQVLPRYGTSGGGGESALTTQGDMLYRGVGINTRLPIGTAGQVLKVNSGATAPEWGEAPATGVTSVSGTAPIASSGGATPTISISPATTSAAGSMSSADKTKLDGIAANANNYTHPNHSGDVTSVGDGATTIANDAVTNAKLANVATSTIKGRATAGTGDPEDLTATQVRTILNVADGAEVNVNADWNASSGDAEILNKPASFTPSTHSSTHHTDGTDALAAHQINGQTIFSTASATYSTDQTLTANRARQFTISNTNAGGINVTLPTGADGTLVGDTYVVIGGSTVSGPIVVRRINVLSPLIYETLATITATGQQYRFRASGGTTGGWALVPVDSHTQAASTITGLATVATTGDYDDLTDKPTIPTASSATPSALGVAAAGTSADFARADHVHAMPSAADVGAAPATGISPSAITGTAVVDSDARLSDSRTPTSHAASHAAAGSDPLAPSDIGAQSIFVTEDLGTITANVTLTAARAKIYTLNTTTSGLRILLPASDVLAGDIVQIRFTSSTGQSITPVRGTMTGFFTSDIGPVGGPVTFIAASASGTSWAIAPVDRHVHGNIGDQGNIGTTSGLPIKTGSAGVLEAGAFGTSAGTFCQGNDARLSDARTPTSHTHGNLTNDGKVGSTSGLPLKTGTAGVVEAGAFGGGAGEFAEGNHTHADLHTRSHAITSTSDHTAGNHKVFYSDGSGQVQELALGNSGEVLTSNGASAAPSFAAASGGDTVSINASAADVLSVASGEISAVDATADKIVFWDDSASELTYLAPVGPTFDGTNLRWPVELVVACSDESTNLTTGTAKVTFRAPYAFLLTGVRASVNTAPTGSTLIVDINNGANSALSTKLSIDASEKTSTTAATAAVIDTSYDDFSDDSEVTIDIDQIGSTTAGKGLKVTLIGTRT